MYHAKYPDLYAQSNAVRLRLCNVGACNVTPVAENHVVGRPVALKHWRCMQSPVLTLRVCVCVCHFTSVHDTQTEIQRHKYEIHKHERSFGPMDSN